MNEMTTEKCLWQIIQSQVEYKGRYTVLKDRLKKPAGDEMDYTYLSGVDAVAVLAFVDGDKVVLTKQYRHPLRKTIYDLPAGGVCENEDFLTAAKRELAEETGYIASELKFLGRFYHAPGLASNTAHIFTTHAIEAGTPKLDDNEIIQVVLMPWDDVLKLVLAEQAVDSALAYAVLRYAVDL